MKSLRYVVLPGLNPNPRSESLYCESYRLWSEVWKNTLLELDGSSTLYSDDFTRQKEIGSIFEGNRCLALVFIRELDFSLTGASEDSYFKPWSQSAIRELIKYSPKIQVGSYITVDAQHRGILAGGLQFKNLLLELSVQHLVHSECSAMTGITRRDKGIHRVAYDLGATTLSKNVIYHGVPTDLVAWYKNVIFEKKISFSLTAERLWRNRELGFQKVHDKVA